MSDKSPQTDPTIERLHDVIIGDIEGQEIVLVDHDPTWHEQFAAEAERIRAALGDRARRIEHIGSTAVPDLAAKPIIDALLVVDDPADEAAYVPALHRAGYQLRVREPAFHEHRMLRTATRDVHVHVFGPDAPEIDRLLLLRDTLRTDPAARERYERTKRALATRSWPTMQHYADAKTAVIEQILQRAGWPPTDLTTQWTSTPTPCSWRPVGASACRCCVNRHPQRACGYREGRMRSGLRPRRYGPSAGGVGLGEQSQAPRQPVVVTVW